MMTDSTNVNFPDNLLDHTPSIDTGYPQRLAQLDTPEALAGLGAREFPDHLHIEPSDWKDAARQNDECGTWGEDFRNRFTNQAPTHECTCHALTQNMEIAWNRQRAGKGSPVWFSPLSVYAEANSQQWGGSTMQRTVGVVLDRGILPEHRGPNGTTEQKDKFRHTLHCTSGNDGEAGGPWVSVNRFPSGWRETAKHFKADEVINPRSYEQVISLLLHGVAVSVGRSGHAVPYVKVVWRGNDLVAMYADSYNVHRYDSVRMIRSAVGGAYGIFTTTIPDNWEAPAG